MEIYYVNIKETGGEALLEKGLSLVREERKKKVLACRFLDDRSRSLAAGLLIRFACRKRGLSYETLRVDFSDAGKPMADGFHFNVSHSGDYAAIAVADAPVGIDVERLADRFPGEKGQARLYGIVSKMFDTAETDAFFARCAGEPLSEAALDFAATVWTRKESFAKECGRGIAMDFSGIHTLDTPGFSSFALPGGYALSVYTKAAESSAIPVCVCAEELLY